MSMPPPPPPPPGASPPPPPPPSGFQPNSSSPPPPPGFQPYPSMGYDAGRQLAGFGNRLLGRILDGILYGLVSLVFVIPAVVMFRVAFDDCYSINDEIRCPEGALNGGALAAAIALILAAVLLVAVLYVRSLGKTGQTWGRKIAGVKVVSKETGAPIGIGRAFGRSLFASLISGNICFLGYLWMLWDKDRQTWHDKIVGSIVIKA